MRSVIFVLGILIAYGWVEGHVYMVDDLKATGRQFDGIGGLSGGGATSKLLVNYPEKQRNEILDYLFKPNFGAALQILKVEIGGDAQSTDGTEASHMHDSWEENYYRGYEWWLIKEAKKRNPAIKIYALPWTFPYWIGDKSPYVTPNRTADYIVRWIEGAKRVHNITTDYVGIWNERSYSIDYIKILRNMLCMRKLEHVKIVASDGGWGIADDMLKDRILKLSVSIIGTHYPGTTSSSNAVATGVPLWSSEDYSTFNDEVGAGCWARILNQNYVNGYMTSTISWNLIASYYPSLPYNRCGLMTANEPWSGYYRVDSPIWITAHTTHFTEIGWTYLAHGHGVGKLKKGGSYVSLTSPKSDQLTIIFETMSHNHSLCIRPKLPPYKVEPQNVTIQLSGSFASLKKLQVWYSRLNFQHQRSVLFKKVRPIPVRNGTIRLSLKVEEIITLTTIDHKPQNTFLDIPPSAPFPSQYSDNFENYDLYAEPYNFAPQIGSFEVVQVEKPYNKVMRQTVLKKPLVWCMADIIQKSINIIGDADKMLNIYVEMDARVGGVNGSSEIFVASHVGELGCNAISAHGNFFFLNPQNKTFLLSADLAQSKIIKKGPVPSAKPGWNRIAFQTQNNTLVGMVNQKIVFMISHSSLMITKPGFVAVGTSPFGLADFDNFSMKTN